MRNQESPPSVFRRLLEWGLAVLSMPFPDRLLALVFGAPAVLEFSLQFFRGYSPLSNPELSPTLKLIALCSYLAPWTMTAWGVFWWLKCARSNRRNRILFFIVFFTTCVAYALAWAVHLRIGSFPEPDTIRFALVNSRMLTLYFLQAEVETIVELVVLITAIALTAGAATHVLFRHFEARNASEGSSVVIGVITCFVAANLILAGCLKARASTRSVSIVRETRIQAYQNRYPTFQHEYLNGINPTISLLGYVVRGGLLPPSSGLLRPEILTPISDYQPRVSARRANDSASVILFVVESLRSDSIRLIHQGRPVMPCTRKLAATGVFFPNMHAQSVHSDYSDPAILSSLYPLRTNYHHFYRRSDPWPKVLIYDVLKDCGYATAMYSSQNEAWSNMNLFYEGPGLDVLFDSRNPRARVYETTDGLLERWTTETSLAGKADDYETISSAIEWINQHHRLSKPFCLIVNLQTSHFPYRLPRSTGPFTPCEINFRASLYDYPVSKTHIVRNAYLNALNYIDQQIERVCLSLDELNLRNNTLVAVTGDHGEAFHEAGETGHARSLVDCTTRVGLVLNCPNILEPQIRPGICESVDIVPTLLARIVTEQHPCFQGRDLLALKQESDSNAVVFQHSRVPGEASSAVVANCGWKYVLDHRKRQGRLLLPEVDANESTDYSEKESRVATLLHCLLVRWIDQQLEYYNSPRYFQLFYPPKRPTLESAEYAELRVAAARTKATVRTKNGPVSAQGQSRGIVRRTQEATESASQIHTEKAVD